MLASAFRLKYGLAVGSGVLYILENTPSPCQCHLAQKYAKEERERGNLKEKGRKRIDKREIKRNNKYKIKVANGGIMNARLLELSISTYEERGIK